MTKIDYIAKLEELMLQIGKSFRSADPCGMIGCDLTMAQFVVLHNIEHLEHCKMSDLANALEVTMGNMTMMIDRLIRDGYVKRENDKEDRRVVRVILSNKGKGAVEKINTHRKQHMKKVFSKISDKDKDTLIKIMSKIINSKEERKVKPPKSP